MAETAKKTAESKKGETETASGVHDTNVYTGADDALAEKAGITEGEVHALRDDAGVNQSPGHEMDVHAWGLSPAGKEFIKGDKDRQKAEKEAEKAYAAEHDKDGLSEPEQKYVEAVAGKTPKSDD